MRQKSAFCIELRFHGIFSKTIGLHISELMKTVGAKFQKCCWSRFLIIVHTVNMATNGETNCTLNPTVGTYRESPSQCLLICATLYLARSLAV